MLSYDHRGNSNNNNGYNGSNNNNNNGYNGSNNNNGNYRTKSVDGQYFEQVATGVWETRYEDSYDYYGNGQQKDGGNDGIYGNTNDSRYADHSKGYGRHQRTFNHIAQTRFDPTRNSHNRLDYGLNHNH